MDKQLGLQLPKPFSEQTATQADASKAELIKTIENLQSTVDGLHADIQQLGNH